MCGVCLYVCVCEYVRERACVPAGACMHVCVCACVCARAYALVSACEHKRVERKWQYCRRTRNNVHPRTPRLTGTQHDRHMTMNVKIHTHAGLQSTLGTQYLCVCSCTCVCLCVCVCVCVCLSVLLCVSFRVCVW